MISADTCKNQSIFYSSLNVRNQKISDTELVTLVADVTIVYGGDRKEDFASALGNLFGIDESQQLLNNLIATSIFSDGSQTSTPVFENVDTSVLENKYDNKLLFIILISLVGVLILTTFGAFISSMFPKKRGNDGVEIKRNNTIDTDDSNSPGKLGARRIVIPDCDQSAYAITPVKKGNGTPVYADSSVAEMISPAGSMASRNPLGIMRLSTLNKCSLGDEPKQSNNIGTMYKISLDGDETTEYEDEV